MAIIGEVFLIFACLRIFRDVKNIYCWSFLILHYINVVSNWKFIISDIKFNGFLFNTLTHVMLWLMIKSGMKTLKWLKLPHDKIVAKQNMINKCKNVHTFLKHIPTLLGQPSTKFGFINIGNFAKIQQVDFLLHLTLIEIKKNTLLMFAIFFSFQIVILWATHSVLDSLHYNLSKRELYSTIKVVGKRLPITK